MATLSLFPALLGACTPSDPPSVEDSDNPIDKLFVELGILSSEPSHRVEGASGAPKTSGDYTCVDTPIDEVRQYDELLGQLAIGDVLWPGSMLRGDSVYANQLTPIILPRAPLTFSVSLESLGGGARSATLDAPSLSAYRDAVGRILAQQISGATPARISSEIVEVSSDEQLAVALGTTVSAPIVAKVKAGFSFQDSTKRSRFVVKFFQLYYTVDLDPPGLPHQFFAPGVTAGDVAQVIAPDSPPVYVSSIGYGRQVLFTFESELSKTEVGAALSFVYQGAAEVSGDVSVRHQEVLSHTHTTAFILGGDAGEAAAASIGSYEQLKQFIAKGGNYSKDSPGAAIAYKLSYVRDHQPVRVSYASMYSRQTCSRVTQKVHVVFEKLTVNNAGSDGGGNLEVFGTVTTYGRAPEQTLSSWPSSQYKEIATGQSYPPSGIIGEQIVPVTPQPGNDLVIGTNLFESDIASNDSFGGYLQDAAPFEAGWRRTMQIHRSSGTQSITLQISLTPVP
ncbi:MAG: thiol-activated cytolysin family protein [Deltaproteobacteria bacterium]|nr:thiol-activated cytolysin family protein [Deltaproteobacteria bacterium]